MVVASKVVSTVSPNFTCDRQHPPALADIYQYIDTEKRRMHASILAASAEKGNISVDSWRRKPLSRGFVLSVRDQSKSCDIAWEK